MKNTKMWQKQIAHAECLNDAMGGRAVYTRVCECVSTECLEKGIETRVGSEFSHFTAILDILMVYKMPHKWLELHTYTPFVILESIFGASLQCPYKYLPLNQCHTVDMHDSVRFVCLRDATQC